MALGPLLKGREARLTNGMAVTHLVLFQQPVADQQLDTAFAHFAWRDHDNALGTALAEASCMDGDVGSWIR